ncbi:MAPK regulated corepressor interacting protein 2-like [Mytilus californianus]|uniref:MAPK regulated corepressor interacting protein 2-like n=1 Tax=Mytilus californianus TaxID=6549 RepID=UPI00224579FF|nr:MAPK regulated corepressor interacting protein 2-like [Mytilus californianus]
MYALSRGPSKIASSTRRGPPKAIDNLEIKDVEKQQKGTGALTMSSPKPTFNHHQMNGRRSGYNKQNPPPVQEAFPQHEEIVKFLTDAWSKVSVELESKKNFREGGPIVYRDKDPNNPVLKNFKPFDLESYWGQRTLEKITSS